MEVARLVLVSGGATDGDVTEGAATRPVTATVFAVVTWLRQAVVVVVAEFGVDGITSRTLQYRLRRRFFVVDRMRWFRRRLDPSWFEARGGALMG